MSLSLLLVGVNPRETSAQAVDRDGVGTPASAPGPAGATEPPVGGAPGQAPGPHTAGQAPSEGSPEGSEAPGAGTGSSGPRGLVPEAAAKDPSSADDVPGDDGSRESPSDSSATDTSGEPEGELADGEGPGHQATPLEAAGSEMPPAAMIEQPARLAYRLQRIDVRGNRTRPGVITAFVPLSPGDMFDPGDPELTVARLSLLATGWFDDVRFALERGGERGSVVLVIEVEERNTLVFERIVAGLSRVVTNSRTSRSPVRPYAGLGLRESNLLGLGIGISGAGVISVAPSSGQVLQYGVDFRYDDRSLAGSDYDFNVRLFHNHAREFFGRQPLVINNAKCPEAEADDEAPPVCDPDIAGSRAVVIYDRTGIGFGTGNHLNANLHYSLGWLGERVSVLNKPLAASTLRGRGDDQREAIDFHIEDGASYVSSLELGLVFDTRDHPATPSVGDFLALRGRMAAGAFGSDYDFVRVEAEYRHHFRLPWQHQLQLGLLAGSVFGYAPFFYHYYAADLSALLPSRQLELNLDHRRTHNLLGTSILEMDQEELAARVDLEYQLPILRRGRGLRRLDAYLGVGLFMLSRREDLRVAISGYNGLSRIPVDLTFDLGVVADTDYGLFKVGFSSLIGFLPDLGQERP